MRYGLFSSSGNDERGHFIWLPFIATQWFVAYPWRGGPMPSAIAPYPFAPKTLVVASGDRVWQIDGGTGEVSAVDGKARAVVSVRLSSLLPKPFTSSSLARRRIRELAAARRALDSVRVEAIFEPQRLPRTMPLVSEAFASPYGGLWLRVFDADETADQQFVILNRDGVEIGRAVLPAGFELQQIGSDFVLGVRRDGLGVEAILELSLKRR